MIDIDDMDCSAIQELLVDCVDGEVAADLRDQVDRHCAACEECSVVLAALREIPALLRQDATAATPRAELSGERWRWQHAEIMKAIDSYADEQVARRSGFDVRILLPLAAALIIAVAGILSLQSLRRGGEGMMMARAALSIEVEDPLALAEVSEVLGEPLFLWDVLWDSADERALESGLDFGVATSEESYSIEDLSEEEVVELEEMLGIVRSG